jgi:hypothetical protein
MWYRYMAQASRRVVATEGRQRQGEIRENGREERLLERDRGGGGEERREEAEVMINTTESSFKNRFADTETPDGGGI